MCHDYPPLTGGGLAAAVGDLVRLLRDDYDIVVLTSRLMDHFADDRAGAGPRTASTITATWRLLRDADCVLAHWTFSFRWLSSLAVLLGPLLRRPTVCVVHTGPAHCRYNRLRILPRPVHRALFQLAAAATRRCAAVIALSDSHAVALTSAGLRVTHVAPAPVHTGEEHDQAYRSHLASAEIDVVGYAGELSDLKGADALPSLVAAATPEFAFRIVGRGPLAGALRSRIDALDPVRRDRVVLADRVEPSAMGVFFAGVDVVLIVSQTESQSRLAIEAMLAGAVVLARRVDGLRDIVDHACTGFFVDPEDPADVLDRLQRLRADPAAVRAVRQAAYQRAGRLVSEATRAWSWLITDVTSRSRADEPPLSGRGSRRSRVTIPLRQQSR
jgi:glycosyltransferase involved in cell wall biosynthesis